MLPTGLLGSAPSTLERVRATEGAVRLVALMNHRSEIFSMRRVMIRVFASGCLLALTQGCTGDITGDASQRGSAGSLGPGVTGAAGATGAGGASGGSSVLTDSGNRVLRRLNRTEYNNTVHDLLGTSLRPADKLPDDETVEGFDTVGVGLSLSLQHLEGLEQAATQLIDELYALPTSDARRSGVLACQLQAGSEATCARQILSGFARRAFRRPVADVELASWLGLADKLRSTGNTYEEGLKAALRSILLSPHFLYMVEKSRPGAGGVAPLNQHELATRLSYFLWSTMPDATLAAAADSGGLADTTKLAAELQRMLKDLKAEALTENFVGQWLTLRRLALDEPDKKTFPNYDASLKDAAARETELFFGELINSNAPIESLLTADFTFVDPTLGKHYGVPVSGTGFERVSLSTTPRVGILTQTSFLIANSHPAFTSPTKRGAWVLEQLLCEPPPPPPADVMTQLTAPADGESVREKLADHRANPSCAACHALMDPIGLGLENFDAIGAYHATENNKPIDATGELQGTSFSGARELASLIGGDPRLAGCFTRQLLTYAVGRSFITTEGASIANALVQDERGAGRQGVGDLIRAVAMSDVFRMRRGE